MAFRLAARARRDIRDILGYSFSKYGSVIAKRYELLLLIAMEEVGEKPQLAGSSAVIRRPGVRTYRLFHSRLHVPREHRSGRPTHTLIYHLDQAGIVEILAVVGDSYPSSRVLA